MLHIKVSKVLKNARLEETKSSKVKLKGNEEKTQRLQTNSC